jgi:hypothetical protein
MTNYLHYHKWDLVLKRIKLAKGKFDPFDKIGSDKKMPEDIVESTVWGITKRDKEWMLNGQGVGRIFPKEPVELNFRVWTTMPRAPSLRQWDTASMQ